MPRPNRHARRRRRLRRRQGRERRRPDPLDPQRRPPLATRHLGLLRSVPARSGGAAGRAHRHHSLGIDRRACPPPPGAAPSTQIRSSSGTGTSGPPRGSPRAWTSRSHWWRRTSVARPQWRSRAGWFSSSSAQAARPSSAPTSRRSSPSGGPCASSSPGSATTSTPTCGWRLWRSAPR